MFFWGLKGWWFPTLSRLPMTCEFLTGNIKEGKDIICGMCASFCDGLFLQTMIWSSFSVICPDHPSDHLGLVSSLRSVNSYLVALLGTNTNHISQQKKKGFDNILILTKQETWETSLWKKVYCLVVVGGQLVVELRKVIPWGFCCLKRPSRLTTGNLK